MKVLISDNLHKAGVDILAQHPNIDVDFRPGLSAEELKEAVNRFDPPDLDTLRQGLCILKNDDLRPVLANLNVPVAAILGGKDTLIPIEIAPKMRQLSPKLELTVIDKAGHVPFLTHEKELVSIISRFLEKQ